MIIKFYQSVFHIVDVVQDDCLHTSMFHTMLHIVVSFFVTKIQFNYNILNSLLKRT